MLRINLTHADSPELALTKEQFDLIHRQADKFADISIRGHLFGCNQWEKANAH